MIVTPPSIRANIGAIAHASARPSKVDVPRPIVGPINFTSDRPFFYLCIVLLGAASWFVVRMRRGTTGLSLRALSGSEIGGSSVGISPARARITAFAVCAGLAAFGGALAAMREGSANYNADFTVQFALGVDGLSAPLQS